MTTDPLPGPLLSLEGPHPFPSKALSPPLSCDGTVGRVIWHAKVLWSPRLSLQKAFSGTEFGESRMAAAVEFGTRLVGGEAGLLPQTPRLSRRLGQWRLLGGESG